jgi:medium-chain acyl-[acyl-carrier-protein] hydrolase
MPHATVKTPWIACPRPRARARVRLFCFPFAGGGTVIYHAWPDYLPEWIEVWAVRLPGRENRIAEPLRGRISDVIPELAEGLFPLLTSPFAFFGHSLGALLGFETARYLKKNDRPEPCHLFVSGRIAPQIPHESRNMHRLSDPEFIQELRRLKGTPEAVLNNPELMEIFLPILRADFEMEETYIYPPAPPLDCPISAFGGLADSLADEENLRSWKDQTRSRFGIHMMAGGHFFINENPVILLRHLASDLEHTLAVNL